MSAVTRDQVIDYLSNLPVIEIANLVKELENKWGVSAAAPVAVAAGPAAGHGPNGVERCRPASAHCAAVLFGTAHACP